MKMAVFVLTAVRTSTPTDLICYQILYQSWDLLFLLLLC
jgi:hypothetical protein